MPTTLHACQVAAIRIDNMTSSEKHLLPGNPKWDYSIQRYKPSRDVFSERGLFSILFLACGRPEITRRCLLSTVDAVNQYSGDIEWIFIENGQCDDNYLLFTEIPSNRKVIVRQNNFGINQGLNQAWALSRGEFCLIHENDWECRKNIDFLSIAGSIFTEKPDVGIVQLRAIYDPCENWGIHKPEYSPWSCTQEQLDVAGIKVWNEKTVAGHQYSLSKFSNGFNNNPTIIRKSLYRECGPYPECEIGSDPRHGESLYQSEVAQTDCLTAHIGQEIYYHAGQATTNAN